MNLQKSRGIGELPSRKSTPPLVSALWSQQREGREVSTVQEGNMMGNSFQPLCLQYSSWALSILRKERVRSVLSIGCSSGILLRALVQRPLTRREDTMRPAKERKGDQLHILDDKANMSSDIDEIFLQRLACIESDPVVIPSILAILTPSSPSSALSPHRPRWETLQTELWLGSIGKYNHRMEGYEAIMCLEVIEHLDSNVLSRFGVVTMGTYRPRLLLVTTPNHDYIVGATQVASDSVHKLEMTRSEFCDWATTAAADWGYEVELGGVGESSKPSYYPFDEPILPNSRIYATNTAIFRLVSAPERSPRSVRSEALPFMPGSSEGAQSHKLIGEFLHRVTATRKQCAPPGEICLQVKQTMESWNVKEVALDELWGAEEISLSCHGSKRYLVKCLGGWGDCAAIAGGESFGVSGVREEGLTVVMKGC